MRTARRWFVPKIPGAYLLVDPSENNVDGDLAAHAIYNAVRSKSLHWDIQILEERGLLGEHDARRVFRLAGSLANIELLRAALEDYRSNWLLLKLAA